MNRLIVFAVAALALAPAHAAAPKDGLTLWINGDKGYNGLAEVARRFTADTGVPVEVSHPDNVEKRFQQVAANGQGPDIMFWAHDRYGEWARGGLIAPLDPSPAMRAKIDDFAWDAVSIDGKVYGYPIAAEAVSLIYNKDLLPEGPPRTFEELGALDTALRKDGRNALLWAYETPYFAYPLLSAGGGYAFRRRPDGSYDVTDTGIDNAGSRAGVGYVASMIDQGHLPRGLDYGVAEARFNQGAAALTINGPWAWDNLDKSGVRYALAPLPTLGGRPARAFVGVLGGAINNASPNQDLARLFLEEYLLTPEGLKAVDADKPLGAVTLKAYRERYPGDERVRVTYENARAGEPMPSVPEMVKYWSNLETALKNVTAGRQSVDAALADARARILK